MRRKAVEYRFTAKPRQYAGPAGWYFLSLPANLSKEIRQHFQSEEEGWGRLPITAKIGNSEWKTAIWFDKKQNTYLMPLKAEIRKKEITSLDKPLHATLWI